MSIHLAKVLVKENVISLDQFKATIEEQRRTNKRLGEVLINLGFINESELLDFLSKEYGVPVVNLDEMEIDETVLKEVPRKTVIEHGLIPIGRSGSNLVVAMSDPSNIIAVDDLRFATGYNIKPVVAPERAIRNAIERHYGADNDVKERVRVVRSEEQIEQMIQELEDLKKSINETDAPSLREGSASEEPEDVADLHQSEEGQVFATFGIFSKGSEPKGDQEGLALRSEVEEQGTVGLSVPGSLSQSLEAAETSVSSDAVEGEVFNPDNLFWQEHRTEDKEWIRSKEEGLSESAESKGHEGELVLGGRNETNVLTPNTLFSQGYEPEYSGEEALNEPIDAEKVLDPFRSPLSTHNAERKQMELTSEGKEANDSGGIFADNSQSEPNLKEAVLKSTIEEKIPDSFSPMSFIKDSESSQTMAETGSKDEETFDPSSFFSQVYGSWEEQENTPLQPTPEEKSDQQFGAPDLFQECTSDQPKDAAEREVSTPDNLFAHDYKPENDHNEEVVLESVPLADVIDPFQAPAPGKEAHSGQAMVESTADSKTDKEHIELAKTFSSQADVFTAYSFDSTKEDEKDIDCQDVVEIHEETFPVTEPEKEHSTQKTVLVVDDSPTIQKIAAITLERKGYRVLTAANAMQALAKLNEVVPDLIFLDINLPHMDGYKLCRVINDLGLGKNVPVVMLSGKERLFDEVRGKMAGASGFITKPFDPNTLIQTVEKYVS